MNIIDQYGRNHNYLRISLTERCNLRCFYCMPEEGIPLTEKTNLMTHEEVIFIAKEFVKLGIDKIRLTGGEPLIKKNVQKIIKELSELPIDLGITTNGILLDKHIDLFQECGVNNINVSLDTLSKEKFNTITKRDYFDRIVSNINQFVSAGFNIKINAVLMKDVNDDEVIDFIEFTQNKNISFRFIEFMPFDGNKWDTSKLVTFDNIFEKINSHYSNNEIIKLENAKSDTAKNYKIKGYSGDFGIISTVSNPFCDGCNRIRLTANGSIKNCLFSTTETNLLSPLRKGQSIVPLIKDAIYLKSKVRGGMTANKDFFDKKKNSNNRSMIAIGG